MLSAPNCPMHSIVLWYTWLQNEHSIAVPRPVHMWQSLSQPSATGEAAQVVGHGEHPQCGWWVKEQHKWWGSREQCEWWSSMEESTLCNSETKSQIHTRIAREVTP